MQTNIKSYILIYCSIRFFFWFLTQHENSTVSKNEKNVSYNCFLPLFSLATPPPSHFNRAWFKLFCLETIQYIWKKNLTIPISLFNFAQHIRCIEVESNWMEQFGPYSFWYDFNYKHCKKKNKLVIDTSTLSLPLQSFEKYF